MLGSFAVGKTSLASRFVTGRFSDKYLTTVGVKVDRREVDVDGQSVTLIVWDLAGEDEFHSVQMTYIRGAAGYLLVIDGTRHETLATAIELQERAEQEIGTVPFHVLINKTDLRDEWQVSEADIKTLTDRGWHVQHTSAKTGEQVEEAFLHLARVALAMEA